MGCLIKEDEKDMQEAKGGYPPQARIWDKDPREELDHLADQRARRKKRES